MAEQDFTVADEVAVAEVGFGIEQRFIQAEAHISQGAQREPHLPVFNGLLSRLPEGGRLRGREAEATNWRGQPRLRPRRAAGLSVLPGGR